MPEEAAATVAVEDLDLEEAAAVAVRVSVAVPVTVPPCRWVTAAATEAMTEEAELRAVGPKLDLEGPKLDLEAVRLAPAPVASGSGGRAHWADRAMDDSPPL